MLTPLLKEHLKALLKKHVLFSLLEEETVAQVIKATDVVNVPLGENVINQGDPGDCAYLIHSGKVRVYKLNDEGKPMTLGTLGPGDLFGEYSILRKETRTASVRVSEDVTLFRIKQQD